MKFYRFNTALGLTSYLLILLATLVSCNKGGEIIDPIKEPITINKELIKGEWIFQNAEKQYQRVSIEEDGSFNISEVNGIWNLGSLNELGIWAVSDKEFTGAYTYKNGANDKSPQKVTIKLSLTDQKRYSFIDENNIQYKKLLGEIKIRRGETVVPECMPDMHQTVTNKIVTPFETKYETITSDIVTDVISMDTNIASADSKTGTITGVDYGMTLVDVVTNEGIATIKVVVDDDFTSLIGKTRSEIKQILGTSSIMTEDFNQILYFMEGEFGLLKVEIFDGIVNSVSAIFNTGVEVDEDKYLRYYKDSFTHLEDQSGTEFETYVNAPTFNDATLLVRLFRKSPFPERPLPFIYYGRPNKNSNPRELYFYDTSCGLGKTAEEIKEIYSDFTNVSTDAAILYNAVGEYGTYFKTIAFALDTEGKCKHTLQYLQSNISESEVHNIMSKKYVFMAKEDGTYWYYSKDRLLLIRYVPQNYLVQFGFRDLWADQSKYFGKSDMTAYEELIASTTYTYIDSYDNVNHTFIDEYEVSGNYYANALGIMYLSNGTIFGYFYVLKNGYDKETILKYLRRVYVESQEESNDEHYVFYDKTQEIMIMYDTINHGVSYVHLGYFQESRSRSSDKINYNDIARSIFSHKTKSNTKTKK